MFALGDSKQTLGLVYYHGLDSPAAAALIQGSKAFPCALLKAQLVRLASMTLCAHLNVGVQILDPFHCCVAATKALAEYNPNSNRFHSIHDAFLTAAAASDHVCPHVIP